MAIIGQVLTAPEAGWKRYDDKHFNIETDGGNSALSGYYGASATSLANNKYARFNFTGSSIRIICRTATTYSDNTEISIDDEVYYVSARTTAGYQILLFEKNDLIGKEHCVKILNKSSSFFYFDAVDIKENERLKLYDTSYNSRILFSSSDGKLKSLDSSGGGKTYDPVYKSTGVTLSNYDKSAYINLDVNTAVGEQPISRGRFYWEAHIETISNGMVGVTKDGIDLSLKSFGIPNSRYYAYTGSKWDSASSSYGSSFSSGATISVLLDMDIGEIEFWLNGVSQGVAFAGLKQLGSVRPSVTRNATTGASRVNLRVNPDEFTYAIPKGYLPYGRSRDRLIKVPSKSTQDFIEHGTKLPFMNMTNKINEERYIQKQTSLVGLGKKFEQIIDANKKVKRLAIG